VLQHTVYQNKYRLFSSKTVRDNCNLLKFISCDTVPNLWYSGELVTQSG